MKPSKIQKAKPDQKLTVAQFGDANVELIALIDGIGLETDFINAKPGPNDDFTPAEITKMEQDARERVAAREARIGRLCGEAIAARSRGFFTQLAEIADSVFDGRHLKPKFEIHQRAIVIAGWLRTQLARMPTKGEIRAEMSNRGFEASNWTRLWKELGWEKLKGEKGGRGNRIVKVKGTTKKVRPLSPK